jgi:hypothetical protein
MRRRDDFMAEDNLGVSDITDYLNRIPEIAEMASTTLGDVFSSECPQRLFGRWAVLIGE